MLIVDWMDKLTPSELDELCADNSALFNNDELEDDWDFTPAQIKYIDAIFANN